MRDRACSFCRKCILMMLAGVALPFSLYSSVLYVESENSAGVGSLREAIARAGDGDVIQFKVKTVRLTLPIEIPDRFENYGLKIDGGSGKTIIDGGRTSRIFTFRGDGNGKIELFNLIIQNGIDNAVSFDLNIGDYFGEGSYSVVDEFRLTVKNCRFENNKGARGGAIEFCNSNYGRAYLTVESCEFTGNSSSDAGGAIYASIYAGGEIRITNCEFENNKATGMGGAVFCGPRGSGGWAPTIIRGCRFLSNRANCSGGLYQVRTVVNSTFENNAAATNGACSAQNVCGCTFIGNTASGKTSALELPAGGVLLNSTFVGNSGGQYPVYARYEERGTHWYVCNNVIIGNSPAALGHGGAYSLRSDAGGASMEFYYNTHDCTWESDGYRVGVYEEGDIDSSSADAVFANVRGGIVEGVPVYKDGVRHLRFVVKQGGPADKNGVYVWHDADWANIAYSQTLSGTKTALVGSVDKATTRVQEDACGEQIGNPPNRGACAISASGSSSPTSLPDAPTGVSATDGMYPGCVCVSWSAAGGAATYNIFRSTTSSRPSSPTFTGVISPYNDPSASPGIEYYYWIAAVNSSGSSFSSYDVGYRAVYLWFEKTTYTYASSGGSESVPVSANLSWSASTDASWITLGTKSGSGNGTLTYTVAANASASSRTGTISVTAGSGTAHPTTKTITVSQEVPSPTTYTVTFDANGGTGGTTITRKSGECLGTLPTPTRTGYKLVGWQVIDSYVPLIVIGGSGTISPPVVPSFTDVDLSPSTRVGASVTYYAKWQAISYTVRFVANGGSGTMANQTFWYDSWRTLSANAFTKSGYAFAGWATTSNGAVSYADGQEVRNLTSVEEVVTLYAVWTAVSTTYTVSFNANGGSCSTTSKQYSSGSTLGTLPTATKGGYLFDGWYTSASGGTKVSSSTVVTGSMTLYAHWTTGKLSSISISGPASVISGKRASYTCTARYSNGSTMTVSPTWSVSSGASYASIWSSGVLLTENVTYMENVIVQASYTEGGVTKTATQRVTIYLATAADFEISGGKLTKYKGAGGAVTIPPVVTNIGDRAFYDCGSLTSVTIPPGVTNIGEWAFYRCESLTSMLIPSSVMSIGDYAFSYCYGLTSVAIPASVTTIGEHAFYCCSGLTSVTIPSSVANIGRAVFGDCRGMTSVTIPEGVTNIGEYAFYCCSGLTSVTIPQSVTTIGEHAFSYCHSLTAVTIPSSVTSAGKGAFGGCEKMTAIHIESRNDFYCSVDGVLYDKAKSVLLQCPAGKTGSVTIPPGVTSIADSAFDRCVLTSMTIPSSVTSIGSSAFEYCRALAEVFVDLGDANRVKGLIEGSESNLDVSRIKFVEPESLSISGAASVSSVTTATYTCMASFADGSTKAVTPEWSIADGASYASISASGVLTARKVTSPQSVTVKAIYTEGAATKTGTKMVTVNPPPEFEISGGTLTKYNGAGGAVVIPSSVTSIGSHAFYNCNRLVSVEIPSNVMSIGEYAFGWCKGLTSVTIPPGVNSIGKGAFERCDSLTAVTISPGVINIGESAFAQCNLLTSVTIPSSVTSIGYGAFCFCNSLTSVTFDGDAPTVGGYYSVFGDNAPGATAYVKKSSTGWGVKIPGTWWGIKIEYRTDDYTVKFDCNGGEGVMSEQVLFPNEERGLKTCAFTKPGYAFAGWTTSAGGDVVYSDGAAVANIVPSGAVTLYAQWIALGANTYAISFNANGGTMVMAPQICERGCVCNLPKCGFVKPEGKTRFAGWACSNGRRYDDGMLVFNLAPPGETVTMTAVWE